MGFLLAQSVGWSQFLGHVRKTFKLAAPHCAARLRVRLNLHRIAPSLGIYLLGCLQPWFLSSKTFRLAAPHCAAGLRVRLDFHGRAPFLKFLFDLSRSVLGGP